MNQKFFRIPVANPGGMEAELNAFCQRYRIGNMDKHFVADGQNSFWAICVGWYDNEGALVDSQLRRASKSSTTAKIDYKEVLGDDDFTLYSRLRELRKSIAERDGVAPYNVFTNEQLAALVQRRISSRSALMEVDGIGQTRAEKYGDIFIECLQTLLPPGVSSESHPDHA